MEIRKKWECQVHVHTLPGQENKENKWARRKQELMEMPDTCTHLPSATRLNQGNKTKPEALASPLLLHSILRGGHVSGFADAYYTTSSPGVIPCLKQQP